MYGQRRWTVPAPPSIKLVSMTICKIVMEMCVVVSLRSYSVLSWPRVRQQCTVKFPLFLISLYSVPRDAKMLHPPLEIWTLIPTQPNNQILSRRQKEMTPNPI